MQNNKNISRVLKNLGACYVIDHQAICRALRENAPDLLSIYNEDSPIGIFVFLGEEGVNFIPTPKKPEVYIQMADPTFQEKLTKMLDVVLKKVPEYMVSEGMERQSCEQNMAQMNEVLFTLLIDIESLRNVGKVKNSSGHLYAHEAINEAARFIGILSDEYGIQGQAIAYNEESAIKLELVSREEVGLARKEPEKYGKSDETIH